jgi:hypothetical protein
LNGYVTTASGLHSTASGAVTTASGQHSTASGNSSTASGCYSFASGLCTTASGSYSTAFGSQTTASGLYSFVYGFNSIDNGNTFAYVFGENIVADRIKTLFVNNLSIKNAPTSSAGLPSGSVWSNSGVLNIVP